MKNLLFSLLLLAVAAASSGCPDVQQQTNHRSIGDLYMVDIDTGRNWELMIFRDGSAKLSFGDAGAGALIPPNVFHFEDARKRLEETMLHADEGDWRTPSYSIFFCKSNERDTYAQHSLNEAYISKLFRIARDNSPSPKQIDELWKQHPPLLGLPHSDPAL